ncbi:MAG: hypothetical protein JO342_04430 [Solirubrobacterales bacterium]|nr:hypothetical protein [Solirubrobacterales bacterium]
MYGRLTHAAVIMAVGIALLAGSASAHGGGASPTTSPAAARFGVQKGCKTPLGVKACWVAGVYNRDYTGMDDHSYKGPPAQAAGGHPFVGVADFIVANKGGKPSGTVKSIRVDLPPGLVSNPQATPKCTKSKLAAGKCPKNTQVGIVKLEVFSPLLGADAYVGESVYNLAPGKSYCAGYASDYAFYVSLMKQQINVCGTVHKDSPYDLYFTIKVPSGSPLIRSTLIFWGVPGDSGHNSQRGWSCFGASPCSPPASGPSKPKGTAFLTNPTGCLPAGQISRLTLKSTAGQMAKAKSKTPVPAINCAKLPFAPKIKMALSGHNQTRAGKHPTLTTAVTQGTGQANIKFSKVTLPLPLALDPTNSQHVCAVKDARADKCPASTIVGSVRVMTPLLSSPLAGKVYLVQGYRLVHRHRIRSFPAMLLALRGKAAVDLHAQTSVDKRSQLVTKFLSLPDLPMNSFTLTITGGKRGILVANNNLCRRAQKAKAQFTGHNGATKKTTVAMGTPCTSS